MTSGQNRGIVDASSRILETIMARPDFKEGLRALLNNIDPDNSPRLAQVILSKDIEIPLAFMCALPGMANIVIRMADEFVRQVNRMFPAPMLQSFAESLLSDIDYEALARAIEGVKGLGQDLAPVFDAALKNIEMRQQGLPKELSHE
jgi:hypothetical protein